jgi:hypothetical protein
MILIFILSRLPLQSFNAVFEEKLQGDGEEIEGSGSSIDGIGEIETIEELEDG